MEVVELVEDLQEHQRSIRPRPAVLLDLKIGIEPSGYVIKQFSLSNLSCLIIEGANIPYLFFAYFTCMVVLIITEKLAGVDFDSTDTI